MEEKNLITLVFLFEADNLSRVFFKDNGEVDRKTKPEAGGLRICPRHGHQHTRSPALFHKITEICVLPPSQGFHKAPDRRQR